MVLPAKHADVIRGLADSNGGSSQAPAPELRVVPMPGDFWLVHRHDILRVTDRAAKDKLRR